MKTQLVVAAILASSSICGATAVLADDYPNKAVEFVVPFPPGDLEDVLTRMIATEFSEMYDVPAAVINRPGGGGGPFPGAVSVAKAPADGYTVGSFVLDIPLVGHVIGIPELADEPFEPLGIFLTYPTMLIATKNDAYSNMEEFAAWARENPTVLGHFGAGATPTEIAFAAQTAFDFEYTADAAFDALDCNTLAAGDATVVTTNYQLILPCIDDVTILATFTTDPIDLLPDVPTLGSLAPELSIAGWNGLFVHRDTPQDARAKLIAAAERAMASDAAQDFASQTGAQVYWTGPEDSAALIERDKETVASIAAMNQ